MVRRVVAEWEVVGRAAACQAVAGMAAAVAVTGKAEALNLNRNLNLNRVRSTEWQGGRPSLWLPVATGQIPFPHAPLPIGIDRTAGDSVPYLARVRGAKNGD